MTIGDSTSQGLLRGFELVFVVCCHYVNIPMVDFTRHRKDYGLGEKELLEAFYSPHLMIRTLVQTLTT